MTGKTNISKIEQVSELAEHGRLLDVFEYFPAFIIVAHKEDNKVVYSNHLARIIFEKKPSYKEEDFQDADDFVREVNKESDKRNRVFDQQIKQKWYHISCTSAIWLDGVESRVLVGFDITEIKNSEKRMAISATTDLMTGLANRQTGLDYLTYYAEDIDNTGSSFSVCYIDINDLKYVNDNFGHAAGDAYIKPVVTCIRSSTRSTDIFARMGGDEMLLIFPNCRQEIVENIMSIVTNKLNFINESESKIYSISYGIMEVTTETSHDVEYILSAVDSKMYYMKEEIKKSRKPLP